MILDLRTLRTCFWRDGTMNNELRTLMALWIMSCGHCGRDFRGMWLWIATYGRYGHVFRDSVLEIMSYGRCGLVLERWHHELGVADGTAEKCYDLERYSRETHWSTFGVFSYSRSSRTLWSSVPQNKKSGTQGSWAIAEAARIFKLKEAGQCNVRVCI